MRKYIASRTSNANLVFSEENLGAVVGREEEAYSEAAALTLESGEPHYVYEVDIKCIKGFRVVKTVEGFRFGPAK